MGTRTVSFIVKIWIEEQVDRHGQPAWHGLVTQVTRDERQYIQNLGEVTAFIAAHLEANDIKLSPLARLGQWLMRQRLPR